MGVRHLWGFLTPVKKNIDVDNLKGQIIAVDLSIWIVEAQSQIPKHIPKPHLRHLFFRVNHLLQLGVIPLIVVEGIPPNIKQDTMRNRLGKEAVGIVRRSRFNALHRECCEMLEYMGLPYVQAAGEAEAMCAYMNSEGLVDGCITNDGDAFLYGAKMVYRNFTINQKDPHVEAYNVRDIEETLLLNRETLIGLAILCGCDYLPKGVEGCGKESIRKLLETLNGDSLLDRFKKWAALDKRLLKYKFSSIPGYDDIEYTICKKALSHQDFPFQNVISEFLVNRNKIPKIKREWSRPNLLRLMKFAYEKLEWPEDYTISKVIPLITLYDMKQIIKRTISPEACIKPKIIVKNRVKHGVPCYEVQWEKLGEDIITKEEFYTTLEEQCLFNSAFPSLVECYEASRGQKKNIQKKTSKSQNSKKDIGQLNEIINKMNINDKNKSQDQVKNKDVATLLKMDSFVQKNEMCHNHPRQCFSGEMSPITVESDDEDFDSQKDESLCEFIPLRERLRLRAMEQTMKESAKTTQQPLRSSESQKEDILDNYSGSSVVQQSPKTPLYDIGNFELETSLLDFSLCQTPRGALRHESALTPRFKIEVMTPKRSINNPMFDSNHRTAIDCVDAELPLLERLRRKMMKN